MILVVDDHDDSREALLRLLKVEGYEAAGANGAAAALLFLETRVPSLLLLDYRMPDMNGLQLLERARQDPRLAGVPAIMFSADGHALRDHALARGIAHFVTKGSLDWGELRRRIAELIGPGAAKRTESPQAAPREKRSG